MRTIVIIAGVLCALGVAMANMADRMAAAPSAQAAVATQNAKTTANNSAAKTGPRVVSISRDRRGHFQTDGQVQGRRVGFLVDTGASVIALRSSDAAMVGVRTSPADYTATVSTANGTVRAARARLTNVEIGDLILHDVDAMVLPDELLSENLLGMSFLGRLKRFEFAGGRMVLEQ